MDINADLQVSGDAEISGTLSAVAKPWVSGDNYVVGTFVSGSAGSVYVSLTDITNSTTAPAQDPTRWSRVTASDTGWRMIVGAIPHNWIMTRRIDNIVFVNWAGSWAWINNTPVPAGFEPGSHQYTTVAGGVDMYSKSNWPGAGYPQMWRAAPLYLYHNPAPHWKYTLPWFAGADSLWHQGNGSYVTDALWPTTLPGTPLTTTRASQDAIPAAMQAAHKP